MTTAGQQRVSGYLLGETVARTGLATVSRAVAPGGDPAIIKLFHSYFGTEASLAGAFLQGMTPVLALRHPNILPALDAGQDGPALWVALPFCEGQTLRTGPPPPYPLPIAAALLDSVAAALTAAHARGVRHGNLKPNNVWVTPDGGVLLSDFGMAVLGERANPLMRSQLHTPLPAFMSPEQAAGEPADVRSETYSLGALLYWMLTGRPPFGGDTPSAVHDQQVASPPRSPSHLNPGLTREVDAVALRALSPFPSSRTAAPAELAAALRAVIRPAAPAEVAAFFTRPATPDLPAPAPGPLNSIGLPTGINVRPPRPPRDPNAEMTPVERSFTRIWTPAKVNKRQELVRVAAITAVCAALVGWQVAPALREPEPLPPPTTQLSVEATSQSWPSLRRDAQRSGVAPAPAAPFTGELRWSYWTGDPIMASPVVAGGMVFLPTGGRRLVALDADSGQVRWEIPTTGPVDSTPAVAGDTLFFGLRDGEVQALNTADGSLRWKYSTGGPVLSSPVVVGGALFVGSGDGNLYCLDAATGEPRWSYPTGSWVVAAPAVVGDQVVVGSRDGWVTFLDANNGAHRFHFFTAGGIEGGPAIADGVVYIGSEARRFWAFNMDARSTFMDREIAAVHANLFIWGITGPPPPPKGMRWINRSPGRFNSMPAIGPGLIYAAAGGANMKAAGYEGGHSHAPGAADDEQKDGKKPSDPYGSSYSARVNDGVLYAWDRSTGGKRWEWVTEAALYASPTLAGDTLYIGADSGQLWALDAATGKPRWSFATGGKVRSSPAVTADGIYFTSWDGTLYALK